MADDGIMPVFCPTEQVVLQTQMAAMKKSNDSMRGSTVHGVVFTLPEILGSKEVVAPSMLREELLG
ncbi:hypothetical protein [Bradyrhizobium guangzhouense]|uniref:Uncharacterized protein n=1 Tax=Bradyrhizobium guangzhouense TaxID=1325095 RepID=A0AAE6C7H6_9BRAD|nr:hypothetical protein [Bradyrhizobium guangzhouense]QAU45698.1 hypothetical protein XH91_10215 [Bradyrhizobium guangzhouense]RXH08034.1 hypothetical protein EAS56_30375 [Bradyrhizobium guangzhouense]